MQSSRASSLVRSSKRNRYNVRTLKLPVSLRWSRFKSTSSTRSHSLPCRCFGLAIDTCLHNITKHQKTSWWRDTVLTVRNSKQKTFKMAAVVAREFSMRWGAGPDSKIRLEWSKCATGSDGTVMLCMPRQTSTYDDSPPWPGSPFWNKTSQVISVRLETPQLLKRPQILSKDSERTMSNVHESIRDLIPAEFHMISGK